jgi:thioredoxin
MKHFLGVLAATMMGFTTVGCGAMQIKNNTTTMGHTKHITKADFLRHIADYEGSSSEWKFLGTKPTIVDFYANWCGPCRALAPALEQIAAEYKGQIEVYKVDVDREQELAAAFDVRSIPTLLFIPLTGNPEIFRGAMNSDQLRHHINSVLLKKDTVSK